MDNTLDDVIQDGIRFLESLTRHYGAERGIEVWESMGTAMGSDVKGKVFFAMLTGDSSGRVRVQRGGCTQAVAAIKAIRNATLMGLKEAKDVWDFSANGVAVIEVPASDLRRNLISELRSMGMICNP